MGYFLRVFLCASLILNQATLSAGNDIRSQMNQYKDLVYKVFSGVKKIKTSEKKRIYLQKSLTGLITKTQEASRGKMTEFQEQALEKVIKFYQNNLENLKTVADTDLDEFGEFVYQESCEQTFVLAISIILSVMLSTFTSLFVGVGSLNS